MALLKLKRYINLSHNNNMSGLPPYPPYSKNQVWKTRWNGQDETWNQKTLSRQLWSPKQINNLTRQYTVTRISSFANVLSYPLPQIELRVNPNYLYYPGQQLAATDLNKNKRSHIIKWSNNELLVNELMKKLVKLKTSSKIKLKVINYKKRSINTRPKV